MMTEAVWQTIVEMAAHFPVPQGSPGAAHDEACRAWTRRVCEQVRFSHGASWGHKSASPERPPSKDAIAFAEGATFRGYDVLRGAGTGSPSLSTYPPLEHDLTGQTFIPVPPINHLGAEEPPEPPEPGEACCDICQRIYDEHGWALHVLMADVSAIKAKLSIP